ncbi:hypothetical protein KY284_020077 [Solanum tuberosum]|nr:hypothetical protein KY284_020077 [Solanum tuberosum]
MSSNSQWMYKRLTKGLYDPEFVRGVQHFIKFAMSHPEGRDEGFVLGYHVWYLHGENEVARSIDQDERIPWDHTMNVGAFDDPTPTTSYHRMVHEAAGPAFFPDDIKELPNPDAQSFYDMLKSANQEVWPGCETHSKLSVVSRLLHIKTEHHRI